MIDLIMSSMQLKTSSLQFIEIIKNGTKLIHILLIMMNNIFL